MKEEYWNLFLLSGKIDDYLNYKNSREEDSLKSGRKEQRESDRTDRDGALYDAGWRV